MRIYRYWAKDGVQVPVEGRVWNIACFGASNESMDAAVENARLRAEEVSGRLTTGQRLVSYEYTDRPLREEIKREIHQGGELIAVITRNSYGALVLNTANVMFIDIDFGYERFGSVLKDLLHRLMGRPPPSEALRAAAHESRMGAIRENARLYGLGMRVYKTPYGYRCLVTSHTFDPASDEAVSILEAFGSDRLYVKLCRAQECFRARLTPKPYRMRFWNPAYRYPWLDPQRELAHREWERHYEEKSARYSACAFIEHAGSSSIMKEVRDIVDLHDSIACTGHALA